jgi:hypothetical protein
MGKNYTVTTQGRTLSTKLNGATNYISIIFNNNNILHVNILDRKTIILSYYIWDESFSFSDLILMETYFGLLLLCYCWFIVTENVCTPPDDDPQVN